MTDKDRADRLAVRCESQRIKIAELESKLAANFCGYADAIKAQSERIRELEGALRELVNWNDETPLSYKETKEWHERIVERAREALTK